MTNTVQLPNNQMIFSVQELKDKGFSYYKINQMVDKGILIKLNKKYGSIIFFVGLTLPRYRFSKPSASLDMNLR